MVLWVLLASKPKWLGYELSLLTPEGKVGKSSEKHCAPDCLWLKRQAVFTRLHVFCYLLDYTWAREDKYKSPSPINAHIP